jgi:hypothetical protein
MLWEMLAEQTVLLRLSLGVEAVLDVVPSGFPFSLKSLQLDFAYLNNSASPLLEALLQSAADTLTHLSLLLDISSPHFSELPHLPDLHHFDLNATTILQQGDPANAAVAIRCRNFVAGVPSSVTSLVLGGAEMAYYLPEPTFVDHLPTNIAVLDIRTVGFHPSTILNLLRSRRIPHLRRLHFSDHIGMQRYEAWSTEN